MLQGEMRGTIHKLQMRNFIDSQNEVFRKQIYLVHYNMHNIY